MAKIIPVGKRLLVEVEKENLNLSGPGGAGGGNGSSGLYVPPEERKSTKRGKVIAVGQDVAISEGQTVIFRPQQRDEHVDGGIIIELDNVIAIAQ